MTDRLVFVEFESESGEPPVSWVVKATEEQEALIDDLIEKTISPDLRPFVGVVNPMEFEVFVEEFTRDWGDEEDDAPALPAGD